VPDGSGRTAAGRLAHLEQAERDEPDLRLVCAVCRAEYPNTPKGRAQGGDHWAQHVGIPVAVELEGLTIRGTPEADPVFELHAPGKAPKLREPRPKGGKP
jgi:hypothetical protein